MNWAMRWALGILAVAMVQPGGLARADAELDGWGEFHGIRVDGELMPFVTSLRIATPDYSDWGIGADQATANASFRREGTQQMHTGSISLRNNPVERAVRGPYVAPGAAGAAAPQQGRGGGFGGRGFGRGGFGGPQVRFQSVVTDTGPDSAGVELGVIASADMNLAGLYEFIELNAATYSSGTAQLTDPETENKNPPIALSKLPAGTKEFLNGKARGIKLTSPTRQIEITFAQPVEFAVLPDQFIDTDAVSQPGLRLDHDPRLDDRIAIRITMHDGNLTANQEIDAIFTIKATGDIDRNPIHVKIDPTKPGEPFAGIGGNFRLQNANDQQMIDYNLDHLRVAFGRVAMPLDQWMPQENGPPAAPNPQPPAGATAPAAPAAGGFGGGFGRGRGLGGGVGGVGPSMQMGKTLSDRQISYIISVWSVPQWALLLGTGGQVPNLPFSIPARRIDPQKWPELFQAITSYIRYMKDHDQTEPAMFSFNEADLGINEILSPQDEDALVKGLGADFEAAGLKTKVLLGDTASPHGIKFVDVALNDPDAKKYIGALSFHSWHDGTNDEFTAWGQRARTLGVPLICAEGGTDSSAGNYAQIFTEPWFALHETDTYLRIAEFAQPLAILHWQLTQDYGVLATGPNGQLQPTQRFWGLKQLGSTPAGSPWLPVNTDQHALTAAAFGDDAHGFTVHLINNGATRPATLTGLPAGIQQMHAYVSDSARGMKELDTVPVTNGSATLTLEKQTFTTLMSKPAENQP